MDLHFFREPANLIRVCEYPAGYYSTHHSLLFRVKLDLKDFVSMPNLMDKILT
jgi:hypothetical protein